MPNLLCRLDVEIGLAFIFLFFFLSVHERRLGGCVDLIICYFVYEDETTTNNNNNNTIFHSEMLLTFKA